MGVGDGDVPAGEGAPERHRRGGDEDFHRRIAGADHVDGGQHVLEAPRERQHLEAPAVGHGLELAAPGRPEHVEIRLEVAPGLDHARRHHQAVGGEGRLEDVVDALAPLDEALLGDRLGGDVEVEETSFAEIEGQGRAVAPGHHAVAVVDAGGPFHGLTEGRRMELVHGRVGLAVELVGRQLEVQHRHLAAQGGEVALDVAGEAAADGEDHIAAVQTERGAHLGIDLALQLLGDVAPARALQALALHGVAGREGETGRARKVIGRRIYLRLRPVQSGHNALPPHRSLRTDLEARTNMHCSIYRCPERTMPPRCTPLLSKSTRSEPPPQTWTSRSSRPRAAGASGSM